MAHTLQSQTIIDGSKDSIVKWYLKSDGASGELTNQVVIDPATLSPLTDGQKANTASIVKVWYELANFDILFKFDATTPVPAWKCVRANSSNIIDFEFFKGIPNNAGAGKNGKITIETVGFATAGAEGTFCIQIRKD